MIFVRNTFESDQQVCDLGAVTIKQIHSLSYNVPLLITTLLFLDTVMMQVLLIMQKYNLLP